MSGQLTPDTEINVRLRLHKSLYADAEKCAKECSQTPERFLSEVIEAYVADRRWNKTVPGYGNGDGNLKF